MIRKRAASPIFIGLALMQGFYLSSLNAELLNLSVEAESAILINADTGAILYEKNASKKQYPASITKVATALFTLKVYGEKLDASIVAEHDCVASVTKEAKKRSNYTLPSHWLEPDATHIGIKRGEILSLEDLLNGMLISSGNDASNVIAQYIGGTVPRFMEEVNSYLQEIGCKNTRFLNPHGLHHPDHFTTAYDMSIIAREAMKSETFREIVKRVRYTRPKTNMQQPTTLIQTNRLLRKGKLYYSKAIGVKTGWTSDALNTFISAAQHNGRTLIAVLIKAKDRETIFTDARKIFEAAFSQTQVERVLLKAGPQKYLLKHKELSKPIQTYIDTDVCVDFYPAEEPKLKCTLFWDDIHPPIAKDQRVGLLYLKTEEGRLLKTVPLYASEAASSSWFHWFKNSTAKNEEPSAAVQPVVSDQSPAASQSLISSRRLWKGLGMTAALILVAGFLLALRRPYSKPSTSM